MRELFIYYRATITNADLVETAVLAMQASLQAHHPALQTRLLRRPESADGLHTWMETYASPLSADGISDSLQCEIERQAHAMLVPLLAGPRHSEAFMPCVS